MALVFLPLNGIGLGHVARAYALATRLRDHAPVIFAQGHYPSAFETRVPGISIATIYKASESERIGIRDELHTYARRTHPAVVVDDTHPAPIDLAPDIDRILIVRPTTLEYLRLLRARHAETYKAVLVADHPTSPTWPFSPEETAELSSWPTWSCIGPVFRRASLAGRSRVRNKYRLTDAPLYVFTMGGGGVQSTSTADTAMFCERAVEVAKALREREPDSRLVFVRGPLFPADHPVPTDFEVQATEDDMPSLLALATAAVIRPGYNTTWECLVGRTPFLPILGGSFVEPITARLARLATMGLAPRDEREWFDSNWRHSFAMRCDERVAPWCDARPADALRSLCASRLEQPQTFAPRAPRQSVAAGQPKLAIRIDDVTELSEELVTLLEILHRRGLSASLEVIPYLCRFDEHALLRLVGSDHGLEIAQHGYAHLPRRGTPQRKAEFATAVDAKRVLRQGRDMLRQAFPTLFHDGFSPPYDFMPSGLDEAWFDIGGRYISVIWAELSAAAGPIVRMTSDPWDWNRREPRPVDEVIHEITASAKQVGHAGLVLHPQLLANAGEPARLARLLDRILECGIVDGSIRELAGVSPRSQ